MNVNKADFLDKYLSEIEYYINFEDLSNSSVSSVGVAWHLDHSLLTINQIYNELAASNPVDYNSSFSIPKTMSLTINFIPRGFAQSPSAVRPADSILKDDIILHLKTAREHTKDFMELEKNAYFDHPYFGKLNRSHTMRFLQVHTHHHLKIIRDILDE
ncbi:MAG: DUF1569 domain-containing protein [Flavobacteriaceae bacterium]|nr:DUF1569 domain-containing protein [Flavobacteriaceae bacterium]